KRIRLASWYKFMRVQELIFKLNKNRIFTAFLLMVVLLSSWQINVFKNDFSMSIHHDEFKKVGFLQNNSQDFMHPILMLQSTRLLNPEIEGIKVPQEVAEKGRAVSAIYGALAMAFFFLLINFVLGNWLAVLIALAVAFSPMVVLHAHYLKEDIYLLFGLMITLVAHYKFIEKPNAKGFVLFALAIGICMSAHYKSLAYALVYGLATLIVSSKIRVRYLVLGPAMLAIGALIFSLINFPIYDDFGRFWSGFNFERNHAIDGHTVKMWPTAMWFSFHFKKSLIVGLGLVPSLLGLAGILISAIKWKALHKAEKLLLLFTVTFYFIVELSPLKPHPGYIRYALPVVPGLLYFAYKLFEFTLQLLKLNKAWAAIPIVALAVFELNFSLKHLNGFDTDTRHIAEDKYEAHKGKVLFEMYTNDDGSGIWSIGRLDPDTITKPYSLFVLSNFIYDRYRLGADLKNQNYELYKFAEVYKALWELPYQEIKGPFGPFGFHNPTIRFVNVEGVDLTKIYKEARERGLLKYQKLAPQKANSK
ncbi:MAG: glycosyltransferase family 39 protein, partial [Bacteroidetes bacterium]|nr:glycosyltransferase family 39 protein [Bacteroidota bacterium]